jgi:hypothetical protein
LRVAAAAPETAGRSRGSTGQHGQLKTELRYEDLDLSDSAAVHNGVRHLQKLRFIRSLQNQAA